MDGHLPERKHSPYEQLETSRGRISETVGNVPKTGNEKLDDCISRMRSAVERMERNMKLKPSR